MELPFKLSSCVNVVSSHLEGGDVEILPERQTQHVQVLTTVSKRTGQRDEDYREEEEEEEQEEEEEEEEEEEKLVN